MFINNKNFFSVKDSSKRIDKRCREIAKDMYLIHDYHTEYIELLKYNKKTFNATKKNRILSKKQSHQREHTNKHMKGLRASFVLTNLQIKMGMRYHFTPFRMAKIQNTHNTK